MLMNNLDPDVAERPRISWSTAHGRRRALGGLSRDRPRAAPARETTRPARAVGRPSACSHPRGGAARPDRELELVVSGRLGHSASSRRPPDDVRPDDRGLVIYIGSQGIVQALRDLASAARVHYVRAQISGQVRAQRGSAAWAARNRSRRRWPRRVPRRRDRSDPRPARLETRYLTSSRPISTPRWPRSGTPPEARALDRDRRQCSRCLHRARQARVTPDSSPIRPRRTIRSSLHPQG